MKTEPQLPSRRPADALRLAAELISTCLSMEPRARKSCYRIAAIVWSVCGVAAVLLVIIAWSGTPGAVAHLSDFANFSLFFLALIGILGFVGEGITRLGVERATTLSAVVVVVAAIADRHVLWQGRVLGYAFLLFGAARLGPATPLLATSAPEKLGKRVSWYFALWGRLLLVGAIAAAMWSLTMPTQFGGDIQTPMRGPLIVPGIWLVGLLAIVLIGLPTAKRLMFGELPPFGADGKRRFFIRDFVITLAVASWLTVTVFGRLAGASVEIALSGLAAGLVVSGIWEIFVRANVVLRGPGPIVWGPGVLLLVAGVLLLIGSAPSGVHPASTWSGAAVSLLCGSWVEWRVLRKVLGLDIDATSSIRSSRMARP